MLRQDSRVGVISFQGHQGEVDPQVGHEISGADDGTQVMELTQVQLVQIGSSTVNQALTQQMQHIGNPSPATAANYVPQNTTAVQHVQPPIKFDEPAFEDDSAANWLTLSQRVVYQVRACEFETELTAAEGERLSIEADVFYRSNIDPMIMRNEHVA